ncbi:MAG: glycosyltransferase [Paludibacteraceae bacterium]
MKICVLIPTFNNAGTVADVVSRAHRQIADIIVVNDGSTDNTLQQLAALDFPIHLVSYARNRGKGYALKQGFQEARRLGYDYVLTLDADGQHFPEDIHTLLHALALHQGALIVGSRQLTDKNMPGGNKFANRFSNFWFRLQTHVALPDTQTGMRIYPLYRMRGWQWLSNRYEAELALLVFSAWANIPLVPVPIRVYYPPREERVSHFRPAYDFTRISILNTLLCLIAVVYGYPRMFWRMVYCFGCWSLLMLLFVQPVSLLLHGGARLCLSKADYRQFCARYRWVMSRFARWSLNHIPGLRWEVENRYGHMFGEKPMLYVCNHQSLLDIMVILSLHPNLYVLAKDWVVNNPVYGMVSRLVGTMPLPKTESNTVEPLRRLVQDGYSLLFFPEGTRTKTGEIGRFHRGACYIAEQLELDICPLVMHGMYDVLSKREFRLRPGRVRLEVMPVIPFGDRSFGMDFRQRSKSLELYYTKQAGTPAHPDKHPVVVLGAGVGGLFTAALLAERGWRPIVLEQLPVYGGGLYSYDRIGEHWMTGCHFLCGMRADEVIGGLLQRWGIRVPYEPTTFDHSPATLIGEHEWAYFQQGAYRLVGGSQPLADALAMYITRYGGRILLSQRVEGIETNPQGLVSAVRTQGGIYPCDMVVSSLHPKQLLSMMQDNAVQPFRKITARRIMETPETAGSFKVYIKLKPEVLRYDTVTHCLTRQDGSLMIVLTPPCEQGQQWARTIECITPMAYERLQPWHTDRKADYAAYEAFKNQLADEVIDDVAAVYPQIREQIADFFTSTSLTYRDDYLSPEGAMFGMSAPVGAVTTRVPNLYLTGQNCFLHGIYGTVCAAVETVEKIKDEG